MKISSVLIQFVFVVLIGGVTFGFGQGDAKGYAAKPAYEAGQV